MGVEGVGRRASEVQGIAPVGCCTCKVVCWACGASLVQGTQGAQCCMQGIKGCLWLGLPGWAAYNETCIVLLLRVSAAAAAAARLFLDVASLLHPTDATQSGPLPVKMCTFCSLVCRALVYLAPRQACLRLVCVCMCVCVRACVCVCVLACVCVCVCVASSASLPHLAAGPYRSRCLLSRTTCSWMSSTTGSR